MSNANASPFAFKWPVCSSGHRWEDDLLVPNTLRKEKDTSGMVVEAVHPAPNLLREPLAEDPALFLHFSELDGSPESILRFADAWGLLGVRTPTLDWASAESIDDWVAEIHRLRCLVGLHSAISRYPSKSSKAWLQRRVFYGDTAVVFYDASEEWLDAANKDRAYIKRGDSWAIRKKYVHYPGITRWKVVVSDATSNPYGGIWRAWIKDGTAERERLLPVARVARAVLMGQIAKAHPVRPLIWLGDREPPRGNLTPSTLLGALYLQAYLEITGQTTMKRCEGCGEWFDAHGRRKDIRFNPAHGSRCSMRASRAAKHHQHKAKGGETDGNETKQR